MAKIVHSIGIAVIENGKVLLVRHGEKASHVTGVIGMPAGRLEPGESLVEAACRELEEETGFIALPHNMKLMPTVYRATIVRKDGPTTFHHRAFLCMKWEGELKTTDETEPFWVPIEELASMELLPNVEAMVQEGLRLLAEGMS